MRSHRGHEPVRRLMTLSGVHATVAMGLLAAIGDINRFASSEKLVSYFGLNPSVRQSGNGPAHHGRVTNRADRMPVPCWWKPPVPRRVCQVRSAPSSCVFRAVAASRGGRCHGAQVGRLGLASSEQGCRPRRRPCTRHTRLTLRKLLDFPAAIRRPHQSRQRRRGITSTTRFPPTDPFAGGRYFSWPAASRIRWAITSGWESMDRWPAFTSMVVACIRLARKRSRSGLIVMSSLDTA
jgi:Transposase IS116/IS110/IS902 family